MAQKICVYWRIILLNFCTERGQVLLLYVAENSYQLWRNRRSQPGTGGVVKESFHRSFGMCKTSYDLAQNVHEDDGQIPRMR